MLVWFVARLALPAGTGRAFLWLKAVLKVVLLALLSGV
jgi:hypothetical protein